VRWLLGGLLPLLLATQGSAQTDAFHHPVPDSARYVVRRDVPYATVAGRPIRLDYYRPSRLAPGERLPLIVFLNGRADRSMRSEPIYTGWAKAAIARGFAAMNPDAASEFAAGLDSLLAFTAAHAHELRVDPDRVGVFAASGNVNSALPVLSDPMRTGIHAAALYYGWGEVAAFRPDLPLLVVRAGLDRPGVNEDIEQAIAAALRSNAPLTVINVPGAHHAFEVFDDTPATRATIERTFDFFSTALDPRQQAALQSSRPEAEAAGAMRRGDFARAVERLTPLVAARPDDPRLRLSLGEALVAAGRFRDARAHFERLKDAPLGPRDLCIPAAWAAAGDGDAQAAVAWLGRIPKRFLPPTLHDDTRFQSLVGRPDFEELFRP
jgi:hypothetical protein